MKPKHAIVVSHSYYLRDTRFRRHAEALAADGWNVDVVCASEAGQRRRERHNDVEIHRLPARRRRGSKFRYAFEYGSFGAMAAAAIAAIDARDRADLVYVFSIPNILVRAALVPKVRGARVILDMRDPMPEFFRSKYGFGPDHRLVRALLREERMACTYASHVVTVIDAMRNLFLRSVEPERISVVMNAPDQRIFHAPPGATPRDPEDRTMLYAGTVAERYGVDLLVEAVGRLKDEIPGLKLRVVGDGDAIPTMKARHPVDRAELLARRAAPPARPVDAVLLLDEGPGVGGARSARADLPHRRVRPDLRRGSAAVRGTRRPGRPVQAHPRSERGSRRARSTRGARRGARARFRLGYGAEETARDRARPERGTALMAAQERER
jgi:glycosyltransferase involved in cell wall biosynthesis